jgi:hypothetical protein
METKNAANSSSRIEEGNADDPLHELDWKSLPAEMLPPPPLRRARCRPQSDITRTNDLFEVQADGWRIKSVDKLPLSLRPDPAFRRFHPIASGLLMFDDLGNAKGFGNSEAATLRYDRGGRVAAKAGFDHKLYRLGLHPHAHEFIALSADCMLHAYDDDLRLLWRIRLVDAPQIQELCSRFCISDEWLKSYVRCVALSRDRRRYLFTAADELWCVDLKGGVLWGLRLPRRDDCALRINAGNNLDVSRALEVLELRLPTTPREIQARYRELAMRRHPDRNGSAEANLQMTALNSAVELLRGVDPGILAGEDGTSGRFSISFGLGVAPDADWIYAADFAADSNAVYLGSYSGQVVMLDSNGEARKVYHVGVPPRSIIDTAEFLYILTPVALYVLRLGSPATIIDLSDGGEVVPAPKGFGVLETRRLRWFAPDGSLLGTITSADPIRRFYHTAGGLVVETRTRRATIAGAPSWWR